MKSSILAAAVAVGMVAGLSGCVYPYGPGYAYNAPPPYAAAPVYAPAFAPAPAYAPTYYPMANDTGPLPNGH